MNMREQFHYFKESQKVSDKMNKLKKFFRNDKEALKELEKIDKKLSDILLLLYNAEDKTDYKIKELSEAINKLQKIQRRFK